ncbi:hypothetical protein THAOC_12414 [Thalassiosira oceanica]|uniref:Uncharacterized protein n=1 Tax=Thalassiosira oceanica TaxID=159749 RepID=K0SNW3_THAOC|nr:hypothetical protein THAOC_12414 [Thalassiosira oceanica]|eukprot:EJK66649.1 hypothetical protein THAOC_12414 [Thalassiosira oceanica]
MLPFSREKIAPVLKQIGSNDPDLTSVNLCHKRITNKQVLQIADALGGNTHVTEIWLTNNEISDESSDGIAKTTSAGAVGYLMSALEGNRTVLEVYLGGNKIGTKGDLKPSRPPSCVGVQHAPGQLGDNRPRTRGQRDMRRRRQDAPRRRRAEHDAADTQDDGERRRERLAAHQVDQRAAEEEPRGGQAAVRGGAPRAGDAQAEEAREGEEEDIEVKQEPRRRGQKRRRSEEAEGRRAEKKRLETGGEAHFGAAPHPLSRRVHSKRFGKDVEWGPYSEYNDNMIPLKVIASSWSLQSTLNPTRNQLHLLRKDADVLLGFYPRASVFGTISNNLQGVFRGHGRWTANAGHVAAHALVRNETAALVTTADQAELADEIRGE